jgi:S1-C subfamily serine protease|tara:strand:+ start:250 stop:429 length:180 start_codon:yes stop_codon:yes gene_type:complete
MKIGDLVEWELRGRKKWLAIVIGEPFNSGGTPTSLVHWVTGRYAGQEDYIHTEDLEVIA